MVSNKHPLEYAALLPPHFVSHFLKKKGYKDNLFLLPLYH